MGEGNAYRRSKTLRCFLKKRKPYVDTTLESPLNGRRRCTDGNPSLSLRPKDRECLRYGIIILYYRCVIDFPTRVYLIYSGFLFT